MAVNAHFLILCLEILYLIHSDVVEMFGEVLIGQTQGKEITSN